MSLNPIISTLGRRLRLAVIGGGPGSFIGAMHRQAARLDNRYELVAGVLSSNSERAKNAGLEIGLAPDRAHSNVLEMLDTEVARDDGADVIAIEAPGGSSARRLGPFTSAGRSGALASTGDASGALIAASLVVHGPAGEHSAERRAQWKLA